MKVISCIILLASMLLSFNCSDKSKDDRNTEVFSNYLRDEFQLSIPEEKHYYLLIPRLICRGCVQAGITSIAENAKEDDYRKMTFITSNKESFLEPVKPHASILQDKAGKLDFLSINAANITVITTEKGKVTSVFKTTTENSDTIQRILFEVR